MLLEVVVAVKITEVNRLSGVLKRRHECQPLKRTKQVKATKVVGVVLPKVAEAGVSRVVKQVRMVVQKVTKTMAKGKQKQFLVLVFLMG